MEPIKLTSLSTRAGCASKLGQAMLRQVLKNLPQAVDPHLLVGSATGDDAMVYRISPTVALVQTIDFFTPIVDDPFDYGQIAATNALSDVYAMGGRPVTAMAVVGVPLELLSLDAVHDILRGGAAKVKQAGCVLAGGHTIKNAEPIYGLSVTGLVNPKKMMTNANARAGDVLVLTKPLGTGIATTGIKRGLTSPALAARVAKSMKTLNRVGHELASRGLVQAATDVTGFGLLGHLGSMCRASGVGAEIDAPALPVLGDEIFRLIGQDCIPGGTRDNADTAESMTDFGSVGTERRWLMADAQTSGGLLLSVRPERLTAVMTMLKQARSPASAVIGRVVKSKPRIQVMT